MIYTQLGPWEDDSGDEGAVRGLPLVADGSQLHQPIAARDL